MTQRKEEPNQLVPLFPKTGPGDSRYTGNYQLAPASGGTDLTTHHGAMTAEFQRQKLEMELTRLKVEFAHEQIVELTQSEIKVFIDFLLFMKEQRERVQHNAEVAHYVGEYFHEALMRLPQQLSGYTAAGYGLMGDVITRKVNVRPQTRGLFRSIVRALFG